MMNIKFVVTAIANSTAIITILVLLISIGFKNLSAKPYKKIDTSIIDSNSAFDDGSYIVYKHNGEIKTKVGDKEYKGKNISHLINIKNKIISGDNSDSDLVHTSHITPELNKKYNNKFVTSATGQKIKNFFNRPKSSDSDFEKVAEFPNLSLTLTKINKKDANPSKDFVYENNEETEEMMIKEYNFNEIPETNKIILTNLKNNTENKPNYTNKFKNILFKYVPVKISSTNQNNYSNNHDKGYLLDVYNLNSIPFWFSNQIIAFYILIICFMTTIFLYLCFSSTKSKVYSQKQNTRKQQLTTLDQHELYNPKYHMGGGGI